MSRTKSYDVVVFDDKIMRRSSLRETLVNMPFDVSLYAARNVNDGLEFCRERGRVDFVIIGKLGDASHSAAAKRICAEFKHAPPIVALLSPSEENPVDIADAASVCDAAITEPFSVDQVYNAIERVIRSDRYKKYRAHQENSGLKTLLLCGVQMVDVRGALKRQNKQSSFQALRSWRKTALKMAELKDSTDETEILQLLESTVRDAKPFQPSSQSVTRAKVRVHPARVVMRLLGKRGINPEAFKKALNLASEVIEPFLAEKSQIDPEIAKALARVLGQTPEYWLNSAGKT